MIRKDHLPPIIPRIEPRMPPDPFSSLPSSFFEVFFFDEEAEVFFLEEVLEVFLPEDVPDVFFFDEEVPVFLPEGVAAVVPWVFFFEVFFLAAVVWSSSAVFVDTAEIRPEKRLPMSTFERRLPRRPPIPEELPVDEEPLPEEACCPRRLMRSGAAPERIFPAFVVLTPAFSAAFWVVALALPPRR